MIAKGMVFVTLRNTTVYSIRPTSGGGLMLVSVTIHGLTDQRLQAGCLGSSSSTTSIRAGLRVCFDEEAVPNVADHVVVRASRCREQ